MKEKYQFAEAKEAFYKWEEEMKVPNLSDDDRLLWCFGYVTAMNRRSDDETK
jgi:hypothetical protein